ncbi:MAG TPA: methyltransferase domain-containing protein [Chitinophagaceae bacterium]|nr:methyltransferase domain-containing protein [Chitinophagaceae bacterium]
MAQQNKHFHMSDDYELHSSSQKLTGRYVIQQTIEMAKSQFKNPRKLKTLDIACGPGNLTIELLHALEESFPATEIDIAGLDYSEHNIKRLIESSGRTVHGIVGSFYKFPSEIKNEDIIFSNHGLHWQPPYEMSDIMYMYLGSAERAQYEAQALQNFKTTLKNIHESMKDGAIAVLQFGHEGQIQKLWDLVYGIFDESPFKEYKEKVNFPVYHPSVENIYSFLKEVGFAEENINIKTFSEDLKEDTALAITNFFRGFTEPGIGQFFTQTNVEAFYKKIEEKLNEIDIDEFRKGLLCSTLIKLKKAI